MSGTNASMILRGVLAKKVQEELEVLQVEVGLDLDSLETYPDRQELEKYLFLLDSFISNSRFFHLRRTKRRGYPKDLAEVMIKKLEKRIHRDIREINTEEEAERYLKRLTEFVSYYRPIIGTMYREFADSKIGNIGPIPEPIPETGLAYERFVLRSVERVLKKGPVSFSPEDVDARYPQEASVILDRYVVQLKISRQELRNGQPYYLFRTSFAI